MSVAVIEEEYEVLVSIFPDEITKLSDGKLKIRVEPEDQPSNEEDQSESGVYSLSRLNCQSNTLDVVVSLDLQVHYPPEYPDVIPALDITPSRGSISEKERYSLIESLKATGEESLGMAMVFTLVSQLQEALRIMVESRVEKRQKDADDAEKREIEKEEARTRGTAVTISSFVEWKAIFDKERAREAILEDEERTKGMSPKERDEYKKSKSKLSGRQLFERDRNLADDDEAEEGVVSVDISQYDRRNAREEEEDEEDADGVHFSDSD